jgi:hypothetical protein
MMHDFFKLFQVQSSYELKIFYSTFVKIVDKGSAWSRYTKLPRSKKLGPGQTKSVKVFSQPVYKTITF